MATLTYDPTPADQPELTPDEQDSLQRGEEAFAEQEQMLAGKFKSAEDLEQAYIELQKKLGQNDAQENEAEPDEEGSEERTEEEERSEGEVLLSEASAEFWENNGELTPETMEKLTAMSSEDLLSTYMKMQSEAGEQPAAPVADLSDQQVSSIKELAGGEEQYGQLVGWAAENLDQSLVQGFDTLIESGNEQAIRLAVRGLMAEYENQNGYEGKMLSGKAATETKDVFRSQSEVVAAMNDPRYDRDPAFRQDVFNKLERSNIDY